MAPFCFSVFVVLSNFEKIFKKESLNDQTPKELTFIASLSL
jgi:hypothetical protein